MISAAERPWWVSDTWRMAKRLVSADAGRKIERNSSPFCRTLVCMPVTKSTTGTSRGLPFCGHRLQMPSSAAVSEIMAPGGSGITTLPPTVAAFQILKDIRKASMHLSNSGTARHSGGPLNSCSSTILQVAAISRPDGVSVSAGQASHSRSTSVSVPTCGSENSQVPPPRKAWPSRHSISSNDFGRFTSTIVLRFMPSLLCSRFLVGRATAPAPRACRCLLQVVERRRVGARRDQGRPLLGAEWHGGRQSGLLTAALHLGDDGLAAIAAHQLEVHDLVVAEEQLADRAVADDAGHR